MDASMLSLYRMFSLYNSPYTAHETGCAIDLYPPLGEPAPSPVSGTVVLTKTLQAPSRSYAAQNDHLIVIDTAPETANGPVARLLHVDPAVAEGDHVSVGDPVGSLIRSGYFAPWVDNHIHLGFRDRESDPIRASGSRKIRLGIAMQPVDWAGCGEVVDSGDTYIMLDRPEHPEPGAGFVGLAAAGGVLDGGCPHYAGGGVFGGDDGAVSIAGSRVGRVENGMVVWDDITVCVNGSPVTGISLGCYREQFGVKLVSWDGFDEEVGDAVSVSIMRN